MTNEKNLRIIKKYLNRRLYDTQTSTYIRLADVKQLVLDKQPFQVVDAKTNENLTRGILLQISFEEESIGTPIFSHEMLLQLIHFYGHPMQEMIGSYLQKNLQAFIDIQNTFTEQLKDLYDSSTSADMWSQFINMQAPLMQTMMTSYLEQSKNLFIQMQTQMRDRAKDMFNALAFQPEFNADHKN
ncbi:polyhydroxyalkanoate synthesis repressor PhaR [Mycoavidus sp. B2-EB]|uniref:polyhydroxyalkanoate synthesis repressor PhaR n=1 Tax=Mycoavidus sp. B2-EB TaxID=2651972 RepID=UPI0016264FDE|nr:polyhydroxyalkanoate synthesis repressor PhaR [Mycoavidus sp. B2-EB]BBO59972.1 polyhydroxyalkanoate synthesis repressor PhaR [Mycoavidus sp. B2-EB]